MGSMRWFLDFQMEPATILYSKEDGNVKTLSGCFDCFDYAIGKKSGEDQETRRLRKRESSCRMHLFSYSFFASYRMQMPTAPWIIQRSLKSRWIGLIHFSRLPADMGR